MENLSIRNVRRKQMVHSKNQYNHIIQRTMKKWRKSGYPMDKHGEINRNIWRFRTRPVFNQRKEKPSSTNIEGTESL
jgi:hypothetical protein